jgi:flagellar hook-associated protein 2
VASAGVTFSGFNNVDFNLVLNSLMQQASQPLTSLQSQQNDLQSRVKTFGTLTTRIAALQAAADDLSSIDGLSAYNVQSSNAAAIGISSNGATAPGHYDVVVNDLARAQVTVSTSSAPDATSTVVANGGSLTVGGVDVAIGGDVTLQGLADAINGTDGIGVQASVVRTSSTTYRLALTSASTGADNGFTVINQLSGATVSFADANDDGVSGDSVEDNAVAASDASILVNNIPITSDSNTFDDVIAGVSFTAYVKNPGETVGIDVTSDSTALAGKLQKFVSAYNDVAKFMGDQRAAATNGDGTSIGREPLLRQLSTGLRTELIEAHGAGVMTRLSEIGLEFTQSGTLSLDQSKLGDALAAGAGQVRGLIAGDGGAFPALEGLLDEYSQANGFISTVTTHLTSQIDAMGDQIDRMQARLALQREALQQEFIQADMAMSQLKSQTSSLASFGTGLGSL